MTYYIISAIILVMLVAVVLYVLFNILRKHGSDRTKYIRGFKTGDCAFVYFFAIPLFYMGQLYVGRHWFFSFFKALEYSAKMVVLDFNISEVETLMEANPLFEITMLMCFIIGAANSALLFISLVYQYIYYGLSLLRWRLSRKKHILLVGNTRTNREIADSVQDALVYIYDELAKDDINDLYEERYNYIIGSSKKSHFEDLAAHLICRKRPIDVTIIVNTEDDSKNFEYAGKLTDIINRLYQQDARDETASKIDDTIKRFKKTNVYLIRGKNYSALYEEIEKKSYGCVRIIDKFSEMAIDFVQNYPLTQFMDSSIIDSATGLIDDSYNINVELYGFGGVNREIFLTSVASNQFITMRDGAIVPKKVRYHIFDREEVNASRDLGVNYYRYRNEILNNPNVKPSDYLEFPELPAEEFFYKLDIDSSFLFDKMSDIHKGAKEYTYAIISYGEDMDNVSLAQNLLNIVKRYRIKNYYIFARVNENAEMYDLFKNENCFAFGDEKALIYNIKSIEQNEIVEHGYMLHRDYLLNNAEDKSPAHMEEVMKQAEYNWFVELSAFKRKSNYYSVIGLKFKLNMIGLDFIRKEEDTLNQAITREEYFRIYNDGNVYNLTVMEHFRWMAFHITNGYIPATIDSIKNARDDNGRPTNGRDEAHCIHPNITTMAGLEVFAHIKMERDGSSYETADVIKNDRIVMGGAYDTLTRNGYVLIHK